jgi:hypothetical protein
MVNNRRGDNKLISERGDHSYEYVSLRACLRRRARSLSERMVVRSALAGSTTITLRACQGRVPSVDQGIAAASVIAYRVAWRIGHHRRCVRFSPRVPAALPPPGEAIHRSCRIIGRTGWQRMAAAACSGADDSHTIGSRTAAVTQERKSLGEVVPQEYRVSRDERATVAEKPFCDGYISSQTTTIGLTHRPLGRDCVLQEALETEFRRHFVALRLAFLLFLHLCVQVLPHIIVAFGVVVLSSQVVPCFVATLPICGGWRTRCPRFLGSSCVPRPRRP